MTVAFALLGFAVVVLLGFVAFLAVGGISPAGRPRETEAAHVEGAVEERGSP